MFNWRESRIGDKITWNPADCRKHYEGAVSVVDYNHLIVTVDGMALWLDDDNVEEFYRTPNVKGILV